MAAQPRRILVGFDDSDAARRALDTAIQLTGYGSTLTVVNVAPEGEAPSDLLAEARERVRRRQVTATYVQRIGEPADELLESARELGAELLVVGRRGAFGVDQPAPGSVSATVVLRAPCDVLVVS